MTRKEFIGELGTMIAVGAGMTFFVQSCGGPAYATARMQGDELVVNKADVEANELTIIRRPASLPAPLCISRKADGSYSAVLMKCTHKGCELRPETKSLVCPCHGSEFSHSGKVLATPARTDLQSFEIKTTESSLLIRIH